MRKVVKFGGSSLASAQQFKKVAEIVHAEASRRYVVPSAPGKRFRKDTKVTDMLYGCYALAEQDEDFSENLHQIEERYQEIIDGLSLTLSLADEFAVIEKNSATEQQSSCSSSLLIKACASPFVSTSLTEPAWAAVPQTQLHA